jgi:hypothetical protein
VQPEAIAHAMQEGSDSDLGLGVRPPNPRHQPTASFRAKPIQEPDLTFSVPETRRADHSASAEKELSACRWICSDRLLARQLLYLTS